MSGFKDSADTRRMASENARKAMKERFAARVAVNDPADAEHESEAGTDHEGAAHRHSAVAIKDPTKARGENVDPHHDDPGRNKRQKEGEDGNTERSHEQGFLMAAERRSVLEAASWKHGLGSTVLIDASDATISDPHRFSPRGTRHPVSRVLRRGRLPVTSGQR